RAATAIDLHAADIDRQAGIEPDDAAKGRRVHGGIALRKDDIIDALFRDSSSLQQATHNGGAQFLNGEWLELSAEAANGGSYGFADDGFAHGGLHSVVVRGQSLSAGYRDWPGGAARGSADNGGPRSASGDAPI